MTHKRGPEIEGMSGLAPTQFKKGICDLTKRMARLAPTSYMVGESRVG